MHLARVIIKNFKSIQNAEIKFAPGKNIIIGKNNSGKSNIIKGIDLVLGESAPAYDRSENITENEFFKNNTGEPIIIYCELARKQGEELNWPEINKAWGYKRRSHITGWDDKRKPIKAPTRICFDEANFITNLNAAMDVSDEDSETVYVSSKSKWAVKFEDELKDKYIFAFCFRAKFNDVGKIEKSIRFFYKENAASSWIMGFTAPIRNELLQSAIIPSFRDPQNQLRINQWTWFGKMLKSYINPNDPRLVKAFQRVRSASNNIFKDLERQLNDKRQKVAFPNTSVHLQFNPDTRIDVYKSTLIYVNDGFLSAITEKGSGIQSAVIIGLFQYYARNVAHASSSLIAIEEPELYLHPQARRIISGRLDDFLGTGQNQVILTTHSSEFFYTNLENLNLVLVRKDKTGASKVYQANFSDSKEKQILLKTQNGEMFFADYVLLVEGGEKFILDFAGKHFGQFKKKRLGSNWLNDFNVSIIAVSGKGEFAKYWQKLTELKIPVALMGDFDFFFRELGEFITKTGNCLGLKDRINAIKGQITQLKPDKKMKKIRDVPKEKRGEVNELLVQLANAGVFVLKGELEHYYRTRGKTLVTGNLGKEEKPIVLVSSVADGTNKIIDLINCCEYWKIFRFIESKVTPNIQ